MASGSSGSTGELDADGYAIGQDYVCGTCGKLHHGPHADRGMVVPDPTNVGHIDWDSGQVYPASTEHPGNFSHGECPECMQAKLDDYHRQRATRFHRGKRDP